MFELDERYELFIGATRYYTDNNILNSEGSFYKYKMLKVNLNATELIDTQDDSIFFNSYFSKQINSKYFLKKGDILIKLIKPIEFFFITENIDVIFNKSYCVIRNKENKYKEMINLWSYLKINEKNIAKKNIQQQIISLINIKDIKKIRIDQKIFNDEFLELYFKKNKLKKMYIKKQNLLDKTFDYLWQKKGDYYGSK